MMKKILILITLILVSISVFSDIKFEPKIYFGQSFNAIIVNPGSKIISGKIYYKEIGDLSYKNLNVTIFENTVACIVPSSLLKISKYDFYVLLADNKGNYVRFPDTEGKNNSFQVVDDDKAPLIKVLSPNQNKTFYNDEDAAVIIYVEENESGIKQSSIELLVNGQKVTNFKYEGGIITYISKNPNLGEYDLSLVITDNIGNKSELKSFKYKVEKRQPPIFEAYANQNYKLEMGVKYSDSMPKMGINELFDGIPTITFEQSYKNEIGIRLGFIKTGITTDLYQQNDDIMQLYDNFMKQMKYDYYDYMRIYNPIDFKNYQNFSSYTRDLAKSNKYQAYFDMGILRYEMGDTQINFTPYTVDKLDIRGNRARADLYLLNAEVAYGNTELGVAGEKYPRNFFGVKAGMNLFELLKVDADVSIIADYMGSEADRKAANPGGAQKDTIKDKFNLTNINPQQNILAGIKASVDLWLLKANLTVSGDIYVDDASNIIDVVELGKQFKIPIDQYYGMFSSYFPLLDFFPASNGLLTGFSSNKLWGLMTAAEAEIPLFGLKGYAVLADKNYNSLGASVPRNVFKYGLKFRKKASNVDVSAEYEHKEDNIPDLATKAILPFIQNNFNFSKITYHATETYNSSEKYKGGLSTSFGNIGSPMVSYTYEMKTKNEKGKDPISTLEQTIDAKWSSIGFKFDQIALNINVDGTAKPIIISKMPLYFEYGYNGSGEFTVFGLTLSGEYGDKFSGRPAVDQLKENNMGGGLKLSLSSSDYLGLKYNYVTKNDMQKIGTDSVTLNLHKFKLIGGASLGLIKLQLEGNLAFTDDILNKKQSTEANIAAKFGIEF